MEPLRDYIIFNPDSVNVLETFADILFQNKDILNQLMLIKDYIMLILVRLIIYLV